VTAAVAALGGVGDMLAHPFMRNAFAAGTGVALMAGLVGYFVVLRGQVFTGDALSHVAFTGALAALAFGINPLVGLYVATVVVALLLGLLGPRGRADDVVIGSVFAWILGLGVLFLSIFTAERSTGNGAAGVSVLFGTIFGLGDRQTVVALVVAAVVVVAVVVLARPLLFVSIDEAVAASRGVPVRLLGFVFLALVGLTAAEATQAVGALLLLGLLAGPAGIAQRLTTRPFRALVLSAAVAVASVWSGLTLSYAFPDLPPSFSIMAVVAAGYLAAVVGGWVRDRTGGPTSAAQGAPGTANVGVQAASGGVG
jgi:zinc/manganese transport system permease protein